MFLNILSGLTRKHFENTSVLDAKIESLLKYLIEFPEKMGKGILRVKIRKKNGVRNAMWSGAC